MTTDVEDKWGKAIAERGFAQIPNYLLLLNQFLDPDKRLSPVEMLVLLQLVGAWWKKETMPFPSMATLADRCGVSDRQIQRAVNELEKRNLLKRTKRPGLNGMRTNNAYDLAPLTEILAEVAKAFPNAFPRNLRRRPARRPETANADKSFHALLEKVRARKRSAEPQVNEAFGPDISEPMP